MRLRTRAFLTSYRFLVPASLVLALPFWLYIYPESAGTKQSATFFCNFLWLIVEIVEVFIASAALAFLIGLVIDPPIRKKKRIERQKKIEAEKLQQMAEAEKLKQIAAANLKQHSEEPALAHSTAQGLEEASNDKNP